MASWKTYGSEVCGDLHCWCSSCGWENWQTPYWWKYEALYCPHCGAEMKFTYPEESRKEGE